MATQQRQPIAKRIWLLAAIALLAVIFPFGSTTAQAPSARTTLNAPFKGVSTPGARFDLVQSVTDFAPGAKSQVITTATPHYLSVVEGDLTVDVDGKAEVVAAGKGVAVPAGAKLVLSNAGSSTARLFASTLLEVGAVSDVHQISVAGVKPFATARRTMSNAPAVVDVIQQAASYDVGYRTANHVMNEFHLMIHVSGQTGYAYLDGGVESYAAGTQGIMYEGRPGFMRNDGQTVVFNVWTWVGNPGKPLSSAATAPAAPAPPSTGTGLAGNGTSFPVTAAVGLVLAILGGSAYAATRARRRD